jgi:signal transduction histidine kinase/CheY-like chemotaxis protein
VVGTEQPRGLVERLAEPAPAREARRRLLELTAEVSESRSLEEIAQLLVDHAAAITNARSAALWTVGEDATHADLVRAINYSEEAERHANRLHVVPTYPLGDALLTGRSVWITSGSDYARLYPTPAVRVEPFHPVRDIALAVLPLVADGRAVGGMCLDFGAPRLFDDDERTLLQLFARHGAQAIARARIWTSERAARARLEKLQQVMGSLSSAATVAEVARVATRVAAHALGASSVKLWLCDEAGDLVLSATHQPEGPPPTCSNVLAKDAELPEPRALRTGRPVLAEGAGEHESSLPLLHDGRPLGVLSFHRDGDRRYEPGERSFMETLAHHCAGVLARATTYEAQKHAEAEARRARAEAEEANRAKDDFLAMLGHELRNPLSPILTALHLMRLRGEGAHARERAVIERQVNHLVRLVDDLLDVSRAVRGKVRLDRKPTEIARIVAAAIEVAGPLLEDRRHRLEVDVPEEGLVVDADGERLAQVVSNLLTNAAKYTPSEGNVRIAARREVDDVVLEVCDDGDGIPPHLLPLVFDLFTQGQQGIDRKKGGLGLGLAIARQLVVQHGGSIEAYSAGEGRGTIMTVRLPRLVSRDSARHRAAAAATQHTRPSSRRVLVVDDNEDAADMLREAITFAGHEVRVAHDGPSALQLVEDFAPDVAFLDIGLPVMDGYELASHLRCVPGLERILLVAVTGYARADDRDKARAHGFDEHLAKPVDLARAMECVTGPR